jgi:hypothetical protein
MTVPIGTYSESMGLVTPAREEPLRAASTT